MSEIFFLKTESEWREAFPCIQSLRPDLSVESFLGRRENLLSRDYYLLGLMDEGRIVAVAGYVLQPHIERGSEFWIHDLATLPNCRSRGYGGQLMAFLEIEAAKVGCSRVVLHTRKQREDAQRFYEDKVGLDNYAVVYKKELSS